VLGIPTHVPPRALGEKKNNFQHPKLGRERAEDQEPDFGPWVKIQHQFFWGLIFEGSTRFRHPRGRTLSVAPSFQ